GVGLDSFLDGELFLRKPAVRILAVEGSACGRSIQRQHRIEWSDVPIRADGQPNPVVEKRAEGIGAAGAVVSDAAFGPPPVINRMIGLHRRDHMQLGEAVEVLRGHVLSVFYAPAAIAGTVRFLDLSIDIEDGGNSGVTDGVAAKLKA